MKDEFLGTEVLNTKDIAIIKNISLGLARNWIKNSRIRLNLQPKDDFTVFNYSEAAGIPMDILLPILNKKLRTMRDRDMGNGEE